MNHQKLTSIIIPIIVTCAMCINFASVYGQTSNKKPIKFQPPPPPPPNRGEPTGRAQGGAGRGCEPTALVPNNDNLVWGVTVAARPQFWFTLPRNLTTKDAIEFRLKDNQDQEIYQTRLENIDIPKGIVSFTLPSQIPPLENSKTYKWSFAIFCDYKVIEDVPGNVEGSITRIPISNTLKNQLAAAKNPIEKAKIYAQNGVWFDAVTTLAVNLRHKKEKDIIATWTELLKQVDLEQAVSLPVTNCCTQTKSSK